MPDKVGLRVAILAAHYAPEPTGNAPYNTGLAEGLAQRGHTVRVLTTHPHYPQWSSSPGSPWKSTESMDGVIVERHRHYVPASPTPFARVAYELSFGARLAAAAWTSADVVIAVSPTLLSSAVALGRARLRRGRPALGLVMQDLYSRGVAQAAARGGTVERLMSVVESRTARAADGVAVIHERFAETVNRRLDVSQDRIRVIRNWTHIDEPPPRDRALSREVMGWRSDELVVLHAGAIGLKQGLENVVDAAKLADRGSESVRFVLMGDGGQRQRLEARAGDVRALEFRDPVDSATFPHALAGADMLLVNERAGVTDMAVPSKLTSYFAAGRPVLAAAEETSTTAQELARANAGMRVDPGAPDILLEGVKLLAQHPKREEFGANGQNYARVELSRETAIERYDAWVRQLATLRR